MTRSTWATTWGTTPRRWGPTAPGWRVSWGGPRAGWGGVGAAVHAGREGVRQGVLPATLSAMASLGARARHVTALLGPAVCGACYEVPEQLQADVAAVTPAAAVRTRAGTPGLDLRAGI